MRGELEKSHEERDDLREELREMTRMYVLTRQERDKHKFQAESMRRDVENVDKIVKESVDRALKTREK